MTTRVKTSSEDGAGGKREMKREAARLAFVTAVHYSYNPHTTPSRSSTGPSPPLPRVACRYSSSSPPRLAAHTGPLSLRDPASWHPAALLLAYLALRGSLAPRARSILAMRPLFGIALPDSYSWMVFAGIMSFCANSFCDSPLAVLACDRATRSSLETVSSFMGASESSSSSLRISTPAAVCFEVPPLGPAAFAPPDLATTGTRTGEHLAIARGHYHNSSHRGQQAAGAQHICNASRSARAGHVASLLRTPNSVHLSRPPQAQHKSRQTRAGEGRLANSRARAVLGEDDGFPVLRDVCLEFGGGASERRTGPRLRADGTRRAEQRARGAEAPRGAAARGQWARRAGEHDTHAAHHPHIAMCGPTARGRPPPDMHPHAADPHHSPCSCAFVRLQGAPALQSMVVIRHGGLAGHNFPRTCAHQLVGPRRSSNAGMVSIKRGGCVRGTTSTPWGTVATVQAEQARCSTTRARSPAHPRALPRSTPSRSSTPRRCSAWSASIERRSRVRAGRGMGQRRWSGSSASRGRSEAPSNRCFGGSATFCGRT